MSLRPAFRRALVVLGLLGVAWIPTAFAAPAAADGRVIVLGFDGADARTIKALMEKGELPNLKKLADQGTFAPLQTVNPAESPTAWASLNTGQNPAKTGVPGFVKRELSPKSGRPSAGFGHLEGPDSVPITSFGETPIPTWSTTKMAVVAAAAAFAGFFILFGLLLRVRIAISLFLALLLAGVGAWGGVALRGWLPDAMPVWKTALVAKPFWETAAAHGVKSVVLDAAVAFDRPFVDGAKVLFGLGYPDARGNVNSFTVYTTDDLYFERAPETNKTDTGSGGHKFKVDERNGVIESLLYGPPNWYEIDRLEAREKVLEAQSADPNLGYKKSIEIQAELRKLRGDGSDDAGDLSRRKSERLAAPVRVEKTKGAAKVTLGHETQELKEGQWSDWYHLTFELNPLFKVHAVTRAKVVHLDSPYFEMYVDTVQFDPAKPPFWQPLSQPTSFAPELAHACGTFESIGWACMTNPLKDAVVDPISFMQDIEFTETWREKLTFDRLAKDDWRIFMSCMSTPDRVQHMLYQYYDTEHPMYDAKAAAQTFTFYGETISLAEAIPATYRHLDKTVGRVLAEFVKPGDTLIVCGDHGFQTFRREVNLNNWLFENGYLAINALTSKGAAKSLGSWVDWSKTRAYALGLGGLYVNLKGREGEGIVDPKDKDALLAEIRAKFVAATDPKNDAHFGKEAYVMSTTYSGPHLDRLPDAFLCFDAGWRVSWNTTAGGLTVVSDDNGEFVPGPACSDNDKNWSGDHVSVDPSVVECIFFSNRKAKLPAGGVSLLNIAPTVLSLVGVPVPPEYDRPAVAFEN
ncbi:MAG: alkaline phosphatase family protein [Planctomycetes bacterium]|nr:alkaline phosphatase family protein [Planctomycetota bacterium]